MSDETDGTPGQVLPFRPTGGGGTPPPPPPPPPPPMPPAPPAVPVTDEDLEEPPPTLVLPTVSIPDPAVPPPPTPALPAPGTAGVPAGLRSEGLDEPEAEGGRGRDGLGGVMVAAIGIAVAALRGMTQWMEDRRQRFEDQSPVRLAAAAAKAGRIKDRAEHASALAAIGHDAEKARAKGRVQSPTEYGRDATKNKGGGSKGTFGETGGGAGGGRGPKSGSGKNRSGGKELTAHGSTGAGGKSGAGTKGKGGGSKGLDSPGGSGGKGKGDSGPGGKNPKSPKSGKSPSTSSSSPSLERARGRQERAADKQKAKDQRRADRTAAQLEDRGKDRQRHHGSKDDRQAVKDRIRNGRLEAKAARKDAAREARRQERAAAKKDRKDRRKARKEAEDRTTLGQAIGQSLTEEAGRRLKERREALDPPVLSRRKKDAPAEETAESEDGPKVDLKKKPRAPKGASTAPPKATSPKPPPPGAEGAVPGAEARGEESGGSTGSGPGSRSRRNREEKPPPRQEPRADGEWLRPPPGMRVEYTITRPDREAQAQARARAKAEEELRRRAKLAYVFNPRAGLPPGTGTGPEKPPASPPSPPPSSTSSPAPKTERKAPIPMPGGPPAHPAPPPSSVGDTQFTDSDLTVYDVMDADQDMAEEIMAGAEHALLVAEKCQRLQSALEGLRASLIAKSVPGVFVGWCTRLIDRAGVVEDKAVAVARGLPRASEAIATAGAVAAEHDKPVADVVRDMGHTAPAASSYHQE
ncbi:hypothetical protein ACIQGT_40505 [Streptomyces sp. NPDC093108]|uniref:hypothetical protein n=1 Tax=Streptomyces sp. NPDC093108 TaxID=3366030 RepID=UPI00381F6860